MSEQFRSLRHLVSHVDEQVRIYTQLQAAIAQVSGLLDSLPEKQREVEALNTKIAEAQKKISDLTDAHQVTVEQVRKQRQELQALVQKEQQERVTAREAFKAEQQRWALEITEARETVADLTRQIGQKKNDLSTLQQELDSTVKAVLRR